MKEDLKWNFVSTGGGDTDGLNNSMIEHFTGNYNYFLAREIIQNSLDARTKGLTGKLPVKVVFKLEYLTKSEFPGHSELFEVINSAKKFWKHHDETVDFLNKTQECLNKSKIPCLRVSDYNTTGLSGNDNDMEGGWFNLVRSTGASFKRSGEGGSFGIGKGAPFASSDLRTVFYSTKNESGTSVFQGKAELVSFKDNDGDPKRGVISYGIKQNSVRKPELFPKRFWRTIQGTDIIIPGYKLTSDWIEDLEKSVLRNFWYAIHCNDLEVEVEGNEIKSANLSDYLIKYFINDPFKDYVEPIGNPLQYYLATTQGEEIGKNKKLKYLGDCKFYFKLIESPMNYVAMLRKSHMVIYSRRFNFPGNFAGVFICDDENGNTQLRKMEPPAHDKWDPKRNKNNGEAVINEITMFIRSCLDSVKQSQSFGILEIPELQKYLPFDEGDESGDGTGESKYTGKEGKQETSKLLQKKEQFNSKVVINPFKVAILNEKDEGREKYTGGGGKGGGGTGGDRNTGKTKKIKDFESRSFLIKENTGLLTYRILLKSERELKCNINLIAVGEDGSEKLKISKVTDNKNSKYLYSGNKIQQVKFSSSEHKQIDVEIESPIKLSLKVELHDLQ
jgi:hypothetical protein